MLIRLTLSVVLLAQIRPVGPGPVPPITPVVATYPFPYNLSAGLQNAWALGETGAAKRVDSIAANDFTAVGSPPAVAGKNGNACAMTAASQLDSIADNPATAGDVTVAFWARSSAVAGIAYPVSLDRAATVAMVPTASSGCFVGIITYDPIAGGPLDAAYQPDNKLGSCADWVLLTARYSASEKRWTLRTYGVGNGADLINYTPPTAATNALGATTRICANKLNCTNNPATVDVDELVMWSRYLSDHDLDQLYNDGAGRFYPGF